MSHTPRIYTEASLAEGQSFALQDAQAKYLTRVMRLSAGATVRVFNGRDGEWRCLLGFGGKRASLIPAARIREQHIGPDLTLIFAPVKKTRTDFIVEKATELGARQIQPVITDYTQAQRVRTDRMRVLAIEAAEQTERMDLPEIVEPQPLTKLLASWNTAKPLIYCDENGAAAPLEDRKSALRKKGAGVLIGPEGGFSPNERAQLRAQPFVMAITLGPRILRAETAVIAALTLWQSLVGDWQNPPYLPQT
ncbi:MAG: 16S rRNA (uracil(1498)-N(3))-methyltransferase [Pseudomonadota bacterium]